MEIGKLYVLWYPVIMRNILKIEAAFAIYQSYETSYSLTLIGFKKRLYIRL